MKRFLILAAVAALALPAAAQNTAVYVEQGGAKLVVASGGEIEVQSGATLDIQDGSTFTFAETQTFTLGADEYVRIDADTTAQTQTAGAFDLNFASVTANTSAVNLLCKANNGTVAATDVFCSRILVQANDADADMFGIEIILDATSVAAAGSYAYGVAVDCEEDTAGACLDGILVTSSGVDTGLTDGIDLSAANIANAANIGDNPIVTGNVAGTLGDATTDSWTLTTDGTGDAEVVLSLQAIGAGEILNDTVDGTQLADNLTQDGDEVIIGGTYDFLVVTAAAAEAGVAAASGNAAVVRCLGGICQAVMTLTAVSVTITDPTGAAAYGGVKIFDFPEGWINAFGVVADITATAGVGGISDTWDGDVSFGTTAADATPTLHDPVTEDNWIPSTATTQAVSGVGAADAQSTVTEQVIHDGHSTAKDLYINFEIDDADVSAGDTLAVSGTVTVTWLQLGDN